MKVKMNILHAECSLNWGGQEYRTLLEHLYLNENGHCSWLMCHSESKLYRRAAKINAPNLIAINLRKTWRFDIAIRIYLFCRSHDIDVINAHGSRDSILCLPCFLLGIPLLRSRQIINPIKKTFGYRYGCSHIIASAAKIKAMMEDAGILGKRITVIDEGIDLQEFCPQRQSGYLRDEFKLSDQEKVIINIGMIRGDKGQRYFIEAANLLLKNHPELKFFLIGEAAGSRKLENELRAKIRQYNIEKNFIMTGYRQDIPAFMHLADIIVIASTDEAQSRIAPQAFASGKTVIATNIGGLPEVVKDGENGLLVPAKNPQALAAAISSLLHDPALKARLENNAYLYAQNNLSFDTMMNRILKLYDSLRTEGKKVSKRAI